MAKRLLFTLAQIYNCYVRECRDFYRTTVGDPGYRWLDKSCMVNTFSYFDINWEPVQILVFLAKLAYHRIEDRRASIFVFVLYFKEVMK